MKLREMFGMAQQLGDIGVESEVEAAGRLPPAPQGWDVHAEDSLRGGNGIEYVTRGAIPVAYLKEVLNRLYSQLNNPKVVVKHDSVSTSTHVHLNMQEHTATQYWNTVVAMWLLDPLLMKYCGPDREHNNFCLRFQDSQGIVKNALIDLKRETPFVFLNNDRVKYGSVNMGNASTKGTVEHRGMRCSTDTEFVHDWCMNLYAIKCASVLFKDPAELMDRVYKEKPDEVLRLFLGAGMAKRLMEYQGWEQMLVHNVGALCELCYTHDWGRWQARIDKRKPKEAPKAGVREIGFEELVQARRALRVADVPEPVQVAGFADALAQANNANNNAFLERMRNIMVDRRNQPR